MEAKLTGLNFVDCVRDLANGIVQLQQVQKLIIGNVYRTEAEWDALIASNFRYYWKDLDRAKVLLILHELCEHDLIDQPVKRNEKHFPIVFDGHTRTVWVENESDIVWNDA